MFLIFLIDTCLLFIMRLLVRLAPLGARQKKPPAMRVRVEGYTQKTPNAIQ